MVAPKLFELNGVQTVFTSGFTIKGEDYVKVYISTTGLTDSYTQVPRTEYKLIGNSIVFNTAPTGLFLRMLVATLRSDLLDAPSNIATTAVYAKEIKGVYDNLDKLLQINTAITILTPEVKTSDFSVEDQKSYLVDTSLGEITIAVGSTIQSFIIGDYESTWTDTNKVKIVLGTDTIELKLNNASQKYQFVKVGNTFRVYDSLGTFIIGGNI